MTQKEIDLAQKRLDELFATVSSADQRIRELLQKTHGMLERVLNPEFKDTQMVFSETHLVKKYRQIERQLNKQKAELDRRGTVVSNWKFKKLPQAWSDDLPETDKKQILSTPLCKMVPKRKSSSGHFIPHKRLKSFFADKEVFSPLTLGRLVIKTRGEIVCFQRGIGRQTSYIIEHLLRINGLYLGMDLDTDLLLP